MPTDKKKTKTKEKRPANHYIDREEFTEEMDIHSRLCRRAREKGEPMPKCPESIGVKFLLLAQNVSNKGNFFGYPYKDEMIADAYENMVRYRYNYDKRKGAAFSYFTQYVMYAFYGRIKLEKKELTKKARWVQKVAIHEMIPAIMADHDVDVDFKNDYVDWLVSYYDEKLDDNTPKDKKVEVKPEEKEEYIPGPLGI